MTADMEFGELQHAETRTALRPDRNRHFAVAECQHPTEKDLPIFVDLDVMEDMEAHALSDTRVELGGVLLGGQFEDEQGCPFVFVTDCMRAKHYKSTKGSFKFTHDTWEDFTRRREDFPAELQIVGWYHTHPGWGVFLSQPDEFICHNFFNRPLDLALVIDPCQQDRGFHQWTEDPTPETKRTGGFHLVASRFRQYEVEEYAAYLGEEPAMRGDAERGYPAPRMPAPVVNIADGRSGWMTVAVMGMLSVQIILTLLLAWRLVAGPVTAAAPVADDNPRAKLEERVDRLLDEQDAARRVAVERKLLDRVLGEIDVAPGGLVSELATQRDENATLRAATVGFDAVEAQSAELRAELAATKKRRDAISADLAALGKRMDKLDLARKDTIRERDKEIAALRAEVDGLKKTADGEKATDEGKGWFSNTLVLTTVIAVVLILVVVGVSVVWSRRERGKDTAPPDAMDAAHSDEIAAAEEQEDDGSRNE